MLDAGLGDVGILAKTEVKQGNVLGNMKAALVGTQPDAAADAGPTASEKWASSGGLWGKMKSTVGNDTAARDSGPMCFPGSGRVWVRNQGEMEIADLHRGQEILTSTGFSQVLGFLHREVQVSGVYIEICTESYSKITVSGEHVLFIETVAECARMNIPACLVRTGEHRLLKLSPDGSFVPVTVVGVTRGVVKTGIYAPLTETGDLVVDGFWCSCYATPVHWGLQNTHSLSDLVMAPFKNNSDGGDVSGIPLFAQRLFELAEGVLA